MKKTTETQAGFSLIELIVTVSILGIMAVATIPFTFEEMNKSNLEQAARIIAGDIRYGESKALSEQSSTFKIHFVSASNEYRKYFDKSNPSRFERIMLPEGITMSSAVFGSNSSKVYFNAKGSVTMGGSISLTDSHGNWTFVRVTPVTGRVRVERVKI